MLSSLPESLDETYERMLYNIDSYWIEDAQRMLTMLCFASRPLTVQELIDSVAVETGKSAGLNHKRRLQDLDGLREICGGLIDIVLDEKVSVEDWYTYVEDEDASEDGDVSKIKDAHEKKDVSEDGDAVIVEMVHKDPRPPTRIVSTVRIAHFSVQEYLESKRISREKVAHFGLSSIAAHAEIATVCLTYLVEPGLSGSTLNQAFLEEYPLARYAATYWYYHYRRTENSTEELDACILRLFQSQTSFATWVRFHDVDHSYHPYFAFNLFNGTQFSRPLDDIPAPIYYASLLGLDKVLHGLLPPEQIESTKTSAPPLTTTPKASKQTFSAAGRRGGAMHAAAYHGYDHIIQILLDSGFDINDQGENAKGTALHTALSRGHAKVVQILLDRGADVNAESSVYGSALLVASSKGIKEVVQMLLNRGADVNAQNYRHDSALQAASLQGHEEVVQVLLDRGADVNAQSEHQYTALYWASEKGSTNIVQMLLDSGACVSIGPNRALKAALWNDYSDVVQMLLNGMNAEDFDNEWEEASRLTYSWDEKIIGLLQTHDFPFRRKPSVTEEA